MFEQEIELEKRQSGAVPLLLIVGAIVSLVAVAVYFLMESRKVLSNQEASQVVTTLLEAQGPTTVSFHTGMVKDRFDESASDSRYRLLQKAGIISIGKGHGENVPVSLTPHGQELIKQIAGVKHSTEADGNEAYVVPLATRKLVQISKVTMGGPERAAIQYTWKWQTNQIGESFDASGGKLSAFTTWDRIALIDKYGARFYQDPPTSLTVAVAKTAQGWQLATE
jgi:hypothetical protein